MPINFTSVRPEMGDEQLRSLAQKMKADGRSQLYVRKVKLGVKDLSFLAYFSHLTAVFIDEVKAGLNSIRHLENLENLILNRMKQLKPTALQGVPQLHRLSIGFSSLKSAEGIETLTNLRELSLNSVSGLEDLDFLTELTTLKTLDIEGGAKLTTLPDLSALTELSEVRINGLSNLKSIEGGSLHRI